MLESGEERTVDIVQFFQLNTELFALASTYYGKPQSAMSLIGVTGTNGKSTVATLLFQYVLYKMYIKRQEMTRRV